MTANARKFLILKVWCLETKRYYSNTGCAAACPRWQPKKWLTNSPIPKIADKFFPLRIGEYTPPFGYFVNPTTMYQHITDAVKRLSSTYVNPAARMFGSSIQQILDRIIVPNGGDLENVMMKRFCPNRLWWDWKLLDFILWFCVFAGKPLPNSFMRRLWRFKLPKRWCPRFFKSSYT